MLNRSGRQPFRERLGWAFVGLVLAWNVALGSLLQVSAGGGDERVANAVYLLGAGLSLLAHELVQRAIAAAASAAGRRRSARRADAGRGARPDDAEDPPAGGWWGELAAAAAGPFASLLVSIVIIAVARVAYVSGVADPLIRAFAAIATFNIVLAGANLLPAVPMDGGRILRAALRAGRRDAARPVRATGAVGEVIALLILAAGFASALVADLADAFSWILVGLILFAEGRAEAKAERGPGPIRRRVSPASSAEPRTPPMI